MLQVSRAWIQVGSSPTLLPALNGDSFPLHTRLP